MTSPKRLAASLKITAAYFERHRLASPDQYVAKAAKQKAAKLRATESYYKCKYGITYGDVLSMLERQGGRCAICESKITHGGRGRHSTNVDHCHLSGDVRGILCTECNKALGLLKDSPLIAASAARYLARSAKAEGTTVCTVCIA